MGLDRGKRRKKALFLGQAFLVVRIAFPVCEPAHAAHFSGVILFSIPVELGYRRYNERCPHSALGYQTRTSMPVGGRTDLMGATRPPNPAPLAAAGVDFPNRSWAEIFESPKSLREPFRQFPMCATMHIPLTRCAGDKTRLFRLGQSGRQPAIGGTLVAYGGGNVLTRDRESFFFDVIED